MVQGIIPAETDAVSPLEIQSLFFIIFWFYSETCVGVAMRYLSKGRR